MVKTVTATRYMTPLREGGSLPAIVEASDGQLYVLKFRGAGQGTKALIAELIAGELGRALGLPIPELALVELDATMAHSEGDPEILDLLNWSVGLNLGMAYLPGAFSYNPLLQPPPAPELASAIVWFDAYLTNVDRTPRNTNLLIWKQALWLIDHGACLYFHHDWKDYLERSRSRFPLIKDHTLLRFASELEQADAAARARITPALIEEVVNLAPDTWLEGNAPFATLLEQRQAYAAYLRSRLDASPLFVQEAHDARAKRI
ncbi:MAG: HipA family kinase [Anaerolineae bacterium]